MFNDYSPEAKRAVFFAQARAHQLGSEAVEGLHLLLGLAREDIDFVNRFLSSWATEDTFQGEITKRTPPTSRAGARQIDDIQFNSESKQIFSFAKEEADRISNRQVGIDHLLLGLLRSEKSLAAQILRERGANIERARRELAIKPYSPLATRERTLREIEKISKMLADAPERVPAPRRDEVFLRYKGKARLVVFGAMHEASRLGSLAVETEHLLLCVLKTSTVRFRLFLPMADSSENICQQIEQHFRQGKAVTPSQQTPAPEQLAFSDECRRVLSYSEEEASLLRSEDVAPEHLLLGMLREKDSYAAVVLREYGADLDRLRGELAA